MKRIRRTLENAKEIFVENSTYANKGQLKVWAIKLGFLENKCYVCGMGPEWNNMPLTLQLDHINGRNNDNRPENLRIVCPNCHTQTPTYAGKSIDSIWITISCKSCGLVEKRKRSEEVNRTKWRKDGPFCKKCATRRNGAEGLKSRYGLKEAKLAPPIQLRCVVCAKSFSRKRASETFKSKKRKSGPFCSSDCWNRYQTTRKSQKFTPFLDLS